MRWEILMTNILCLDDYIDYLAEKGSSWVCCDCVECPETRSGAESHYDDFTYEAIYFKLIGRDCGNPGTWKWSQTIETGGYREDYDVIADGERFFNRCVCADSQFVCYEYIPAKAHQPPSQGRRLEVECPHCWLKEHREAGLIEEEEE